MLTVVEASWWGRRAAFPASGTWKLIADQGIMKLEHNVAISKDKLKKSAAT